MDVIEVGDKLVGPLGTPPAGTDTLVGLKLLGTIAQAVSKTAQVRVRYLERVVNDAAEVKEYIGVARHVVDPDHHGFARLPWKPTDRLRITTGFEWFLPLEDIINVEIIEEK